jgi:hypothetical protein
MVARAPLDMMTQALGTALIVRKRRLAHGAVVNCGALVEVMILLSLFRRREESGVKGEWLTEAAAFFPPIDVVRHLAYQASSAVEMVFCWTSGSKRYFRGAPAAEQKLEGDVEGWRQTRPACSSQRWYRVNIAAWAVRCDEGLQTMTTPCLISLTDAGASFEGGARCRGVMPNAPDSARRRAQRRRI